MKQVNKILDKKEVANTSATANFIQSINELVETGLASNAKEVYTKIGSEQSKFSKIKSGERNLSVDMVSSIVTEYNVNANYIFAKDGPTTEPLIRESSINSAVIHGNNNSVHNQHGRVISSVTTNHGAITIAEKIINTIPDKKERAIIKKQMTDMNDKVEALKKMIAGYEKQMLDKDEALSLSRKLIKSQEEQLEFYKSQIPKKTIKK